MKYKSNPLALKIVAHIIVEFFNGKTGPFLEQGNVVFGGVRKLLDEQFARLSVLEQSLVLLACHPARTGHSVRASGRP